MPEGNLQERTSYYDDAVQRSGLSPTHRYLLDQIAKGSVVLELGPASGYMTRILKDRECIIDAIELNPEDAAKANPFCRTMITGSLDNVEVFRNLPGPYEVILMADVLEHLRAPENLLPEIRRRLSPDGLALVSLPNIAFWKMRFELLRGRFDYTDMGLLDRTHLRFYTIRSATQMFQKAGFRVERVVVPPHDIPRLGGLKMALMRMWPSLFAFNLVYHLRADEHRA